MQNTIESSPDARRDLAIVRTHKWGETEDKLADILRRSFAKVIAVYHNPPADLDIGIEVVPLVDKWVTERGLRAHRRYGWLCGDYCHYLARERFPDYAHYWLIETDVWLHGDSDEFFRLCRNSDADGLAAGIRDARGNLSPAWIASVGNRTPIRAFFPMTRLSGRAVDHLFEERIRYARSGVTDAAFCNDSLFVFTWLHAAPQLRYDRLEDVAPGWFDKTFFNPDPDILRDAIPLIAGDNSGAWHPVRNREIFVQISAERAAHALSKSIQLSAQAVEPVDIEAIAARFADILREKVARNIQKDRVMRVRRQLSRQDSR